MKLDESRLSELTAKIKEGTVTQEEREELGNSFVKVVFHIARHQGTSNHTKVDDYISAGLFGLAYAIANAQSMGEVDLKKWILTWIRRHIGKFRQGDHAVRVPSRTYFRCKKLGIPLPVVPETEPFKAEPFRKTTDMSEVREILDMCASDDEDLEIIKLRSRGHTIREVARQTGIPKTEVMRRCSIMSIEYDRLMKETE